MDFKTILYVGVLMLTSCKDDSPADETVIPEQPEEVFCEQSICWDPGIYTCRDSVYNKLFTRRTGWTGGDATYSVDLKNGKTLWMFGDSFIDQVSEDRSRPSFKLINNCLVLQDGLQLTTIHGGTSVNVQAFAKPPETGNWYWPGDATVANDKLYMFMHGFGNDGGGAWDFYRTSIDLLTINIETMKIENNTRLFDNPSVSWGASILEDADFTYVFGVASNNTDKQLYIARTNVDLTATWEYYAGSGWSSSPFNATPIFSGVSEQFSVFKDNGVYYLLNQHNLFGKEISLYTSSAPQGPFIDGKIVYCTPESSGSIFTYNAFAHPHIYSDSLLISYNVNSFDASDVLKSADNYRPYFIKIGGWRKQ